MLKITSEFVDPQAPGRAGQVFASFLTQDGIPAWKDVLAFLKEQIPAPLLLHRTRSAYQGQFDSRKFETLPLPKIGRIHFSINAPDLTDESEDLEMILETLRGLGLDVRVEK